MMGVNSLPKAVTRQHHGCDLNPGSSAPESSMLTMWLPRNPSVSCAKMARPIDYRDDVWGVDLRGQVGPNPRHRKWHFWGSYFGMPRVACSGYFHYVITPPLVRVADSCDECVSVCLSVCVFVCRWSYLRNYRPDLHQFFCLFPVAMAWSSSGGIAIR